MEIGSLLARRLVDVCQGQHLDLTIGRAQHLTLEEYDQILANKTGEINGTICEAGAILAGASDQRPLWRTLGVERAIVQQLYDDYTDLAEDILNGNQVSHFILYGLAVAGEAQRKTIIALLEHARSGAEDAPLSVQELIGLLRELGAEYYTLTRMVLHRNRALAALDALQLPEHTRGWLYEWVVRVSPLQTPLP
jgi:geranylgeranyl pyrophosphate synthase